MPICCEMIGYRNRYRLNQESDIGNFAVKSGYLRKTTVVKTIEFYEFAETFFADNICVGPWNRCKAQSMHCQKLCKMCPNNQ